MHPTSRRLRPLAALAAVLFLTAGLGLAGCSSGGGDGSAAEGSSAGHAPESAADADALTAEADGGRSFSGSAAGRVSEVADPPGSTAEPAIIQTGSMTVQSDDVAQARFDLEKVVDAHGGSIADEKTTATSEGDVELSRLELRIPSADFDAAMDELAELGEVTESTRKAQDVTGEVIDTQARIRAQEQSLARVEVLFARAQDIRDIVAIEAQLSRRQAELDSLEGQLAYLRDQTTLSTITVYLEPTPDPRRTVVDDDDSAFVGGLKTGWHALAAVGSGLASVAGALLPFAVVVLVLGVPLTVLTRRWLVRHPLRRPTAEA